MEKFFVSEEKKFYRIGHWCQFYQHVYKKLLSAKIPKALKESQVISVFLHFWDLCTQKLLLNVGEIDTRKAQSSQFLNNETLSNLCFVATYHLHIHYIEFSEKINFRMSHSQ
jgi:hypothetical protein